MIEMKEKGNKCTNCNQKTKDIIEEDDSGIYFHCSNCDMSDEIYKTSKEDFCESLFEDYDTEDVLEFGDEYFENLRSMKENVINFKHWIDINDKEVRL